MRGQNFMLMLEDLYGVQAGGGVQIGQGPLHIAPMGVLREDGTRHDLERSLRRPPMLGAIVLKQAIVNPHEALPFTLSHQRRRVWGTFFLRLGSSRLVEGGL